MTRPVTELMNIRCPSPLRIFSPEFVFRVYPCVLLSLSFPLSQVAQLTNLSEVAHDVIIYS
jgi:hypothetical protein